jgi:hypothetical protein
MNTDIFRRRVSSSVVFHVVPIDITEQESDEPAD